MRADLKVVASLVPEGSRVLDLGCGDGVLLEFLARDLGCTGTGVDSDGPSLISAIRRGVSVMDLDIDAQLGEFADGSYDLVVVSQTLQATRAPAHILEEIKRIAGRGIVSVPNFALWKHRLSLLVRGRMPVSRALPYSWHDTPNIHLATLGDLEDLFAVHGLQIERRVLLDSSGKARSSRSGAAPATAWAPANLMASGAAYLISG